MVSDQFDSDKFATFSDGQAHPDCIVLLMLGGMISPVFSVDCKVTEITSASPEVTRSEGNAIYRIGNMSFCDYLGSLGFSEHITQIRDFPLCVIIQNKPDRRDSLPEITHLTLTDPLSGSGYFGTEIPVGCKIRFGHVTRKDLVVSARHCMLDATERMRKQTETGYVFSMGVCIPCMGRHYALQGGENTDGEIVTSHLPPALPLFGYYGFNEICPSRDGHGIRFNRTHNDSIAFCAF